MTYRAVDLAYTNPNLVQFCKDNDVQAILGYVFNPFLGGWYPAGWSSAFVQSIIDAGIKYIPIATMKTASGELAAAAAVAAAINSMPKNTDLVVIDVETGSDPGKDWVNAWTAEMRTYGFRTIVYGNGSTLSAGYTIGCFSWGADYVDTKWNDRIDPAPRGWDGFQYAGDVSPGGFGIDLSAFNIPLSARERGWWGG